MNVASVNDCTRDCNDDWGGEAYLDECGICDHEPINDCIQDCNGVWGGDAKPDNCDTCDNDPNNNCIQDCNGVWGGNTGYDSCGQCEGLGKLVYYMDDDGDGYGNCEMIFNYCPQTVPEGLVTNCNDCDDENNLVWELDECNICGGSGKVNRCYDNDGDGLGRQPVYEG